MNAGSSGPWEQIALFNAGPIIPYEPGWRLIANGSGTQGWHLIERTTPERGVVTVCGIVGRVVRSEAPIMTSCPNCTGA